ncbi:hypothetical protein [Mycobacteroides abscessus]|uniref:hypothetical protein n=1 Tax=Mycobacteroides abscessus TaxID=36809 RepID=UPI00215CDD8E|nr:hypothetical protein [Mycobacteroides abscessus]
MVEQFSDDDRLEPQDVADQVEALARGVLATNSVGLQQLRTTLPDLSSEKAAALAKRIRLMQKQDTAMHAELLGLVERLRNLGS